MDIRKPIWISCIINNDQAMWFHFQKSLPGYTHRNLNWNNMLQNRLKIFQGSVMVQFLSNNQEVAKWTLLFLRKRLPGRDCNPATSLSLLTFILHRICEPHSSKVPHFSSLFLLSLFLVRNFSSYFLRVEFCFLCGFNFSCMIGYGVHIKCVCSV